MRLIAAAVVAAILCTALLALVGGADAARMRFKQRVRRGVSAIEAGELADAAHGLLTQDELDAQTEAEAEDTPTSTITPPSPVSTPTSTTPAPPAPSASAPAPAPSPTPAPSTPAPAATTPAPAPAGTPPPSPAPSASNSLQQKIQKQIAQMQKKAEAKAKREAKAKERAAKKAAAAEKRKAEKAKRKAERKAKREAEAKKRTEREAKKKAEREAKQKAAKEAKSKAAKEKAEKDAKAKADKEKHASDADSGVWKEVAHNPWPPHNLGIKSWVLTGIGANAIKLHRVVGGAGLPNPTPMRLTFDIGWDTDLHKMVEHYKDKSRLNGVLYYVSRNGKAVAKLTFGDAVISAIKFPKLRSRGKRADKPARMTIVLQPANSKVERIDKVTAAPDAPDVDSDKRHAVKRKDFKFEVEGVDTSKVLAVKLPSVVMRVKRATKYAYSPEAKKQVPHTRLKVVGYKNKFLFVTVPKADVKQWRDWQTERPARPRAGSCEILQEPPRETDEDGGAPAPAPAAPAPPPAPTPAPTTGASATPAVGDAAAPAAPASDSKLTPLYHTKMNGLYINRIVEKKDRAVIELTFDSYAIDHVAGDD